MADRPRSGARPANARAAPRPPKLLRLAVIATTAGAFSALFGVGGGTIIVPLLVLWMGYGEREATGTSLAAIVGIAALGAIAHGLYGNAHLLEGFLIGVPAVGGVIAGTALQQRVPERAVSAVFAVLLVVSAVALVL
ncbi:MAG: sulfite exporter TauE/SafE family protein [Thermoleophilaceae bacterium]